MKPNKIVSVHTITMEHRGYSTQYVFYRKASARTYRDVSEYSSARLYRVLRRIRQERVTTLYRYNSDWQLVIAPDEYVPQRYWKAVSEPDYRRNVRMLNKIACMLLYRWSSASQAILRGASYVDESLQHPVEDAIENWGADWSPLDSYPLDALHDIESLLRVMDRDGVAWQALIGYRCTGTVFFTDVTYAPDYMAGDPEALWFYYDELGSTYIGPTYRAIETVRYIHPQQAGKE